MDWNDLRYLLAVHQAGSLAGAAKALHVTKATASRRLAALEESLGAKLMTRTPRGLALTPAGLEAVAAAEAMAATVAALDARISQQADTAPKGIVKVTAPPWIAERYLIPRLAELKAKYPELEVDLNGTNQMLNLAQREADLAIRNVKPDQNSLASRKLVPLGGCVYASKLYLERRGVPRSRKDLAGHDLLVYEQLGGMPGFEWLRDTPTGGRIAFRANDPVALVGAATAGLGLCAVPCLIGDSEPALSRVESLGFERCEMFLVMHESARAAARVRVVSDFICAALEAHRAQISG